MQDRQASLWKKWLAAAGAAVLIAYSAYPLISYLLLWVDEYGVGFGNALMPVLLSIQALIFVLALFWQSKRPSISQNFETATLCAGALLLLAVAALFIIVLLEAAADTSLDQSGATAGFFMLVIFGGYYSFQAVVLLIVGYVLRRRRVAASGKS